MDSENTKAALLFAELAKKQAIAAASKPYLSLERRSTYLFDVSFEKAPPDTGVDSLPGMCSSYVQDGKLFRLLDWKYNHNATFHVRLPGIEGLAFIEGLTDSNLDKKLIEQLPYHLVDGVNEHGIIVATHVLYNDWNAVGNGEIPLTYLPYVVLSRVKSMATLTDDLDGVLDNLKSTPALIASGYLIQVLVTDGVTSYVLRPGNATDATYEAVDITENAKLSNFRWVPDETVVRADLQRRPTGVERWNMMPCPMEDLRFTKCYENATRLSEFIGLRDTDKDSTDEELTAIYNTAHALYLRRERDGELWQTMHSVVYSTKGIEHLYVQEDWTKDYAGSDAPTKLSDLESDPLHRTVTDAEKTAWNEKADKILLAQEYASTATYAVGAFCLRENTLYRCIVAIPAGEVWTPAHWAETTVAVELIRANAEMVGASSSTDGQAGKVPPPASADREKFLRGDGSWATPPAGGGGDTAGVVAPAYSSNETYSVDDLVIYDALLYRCISDIDTPEAWTPAHWEQTTVDVEMAKYMKYSTLVVTCLTQDGVTVTGQTVTVRKGDASGTVYATAAYNGQPVSILIPVGFDYHVSVSDTLDHHFNPTTARGVVNAPTINVTLTYSDFSNIKTFGDVKAALNADIDLTGLVGEQVTATRQNKSLVFDVADYDATDKSVWLLLHDTMPTQMAFEPGQALAYFENGLAAGAYSFIHSGKTYYFSLTQPIPEGGQLKATTSAFSTYASQGTSTAIESGNVSQTEITGATSLGTTASGDLNHMDRVNYGSNNSGESGLFAWLNSDAAPNTNLPRINKFSRPYSSGSDGGFLYGFDADDLACLEENTWAIQANNVYEAPASMGGITTKGQQYNITGKIGLAKFANVGLSGSNPWDLYVGATNADRIKYYNGGARLWWVFDVVTGYAHNEYIVISSGGSGNVGAYNSYGVVPACKIKKSA